MTVYLSWIQEGLTAEKEKHRPPGPGLCSLGGEACIFSKDFLKKHCRNKTEKEREREREISLSLSKKKGKICVDSKKALPKASFKAKNSK